MKLKNIVAMISFLFVAVSCSMEDDVLNEVTKSDSSNNSNQTEVYLSVNAMVNSINTKASTSWGEEEADASTISTCSVILFENNKVIGVYDNSPAVKDGDAYKLSNARFLVKTGRYYEVYVIANATQAFSTCDTKAAVEAIAFGNTELTNKVKFGRATVNIPASDGNPSASANYTTQTVTVPLTNQTAQIRFMDVLYSGFKNNTNPTTVVLQKIELLNQNVKYSLNGEEYEIVKESATNTWTGTYDVKDAAKNDYSETAFWSRSTFPNTNLDDKVALRLTFKVGSNNTETRTYIINRPTGVANPNGAGGAMTNGNTGSYVNAGCIYQLYATVAVDGDTFNCTIKCCTKDWLYNEYEVTMTEL